MMGNLWCSINRNTNICGSDKPIFNSRLIIRIEHVINHNTNICGYDKPIFN
jgi:hypothetical protein